MNKLRVLYRHLPLAEKCSNKIFQYYQSDISHTDNNSLKYFNNATKMLETLLKHKTILKFCQVFLYNLNSVIDSQLFLKFRKKF